MNSSRERYFLDVISRRRRSAAAAIARAALSAAEVPYVAMMSARNALYARGVLRSHAIDRPVVCVGNLTTGGTGKTPVVRWLVEQLRARGHRPAVLTRGYRSNAPEGGDEQLLLHRLLGDDVPVQAEPDRIAGARAIARAHPEVDVIVLDDGFQHRRLARDFDLVLIDATNPFGFEHVLPRGLLREPVRGLGRASAVLLTHVELVDDEELSRVEARIRACNAAAPIYRARHEPNLEDARGRRVFAFCGIGNPEAFERQLARSATVVGSRRFGDHHAYSAFDLKAVCESARASGAQMLVTTEKDWVKLERLPTGGFPLVAIRLELRFENDDGARLMDQIETVIRQSLASKSPQAPVATTTVAG
jgi:tetraacyldisaccharide 4'-kinase